MKLIALMMAIAMAGVGCAHAQRSKSSESRAYVVSKNAEGLGTELAIGGAGGHDCQEEHLDCMDRC